MNRLRSSGTGRFSRLADAFSGPPKTVGKLAPGEIHSEKIVVAQSDSSGNEQLGTVAATLLEPIATAGFVLIMVIFMLIRREDLRNRVIGLLGHNRLTGTTRVLVESATRISRLLLMQLMINTGFGLLFGVGMLIIGVPYSFLWGFLAVVLRFIPYVGAWMAALLPMVLSFAIAPNFTQPLLVLGVFLLLDLTTSNVVEPLLFSHSTGVSAVALLVAAVFWTWVWGPIGLVLSTPLTVCLVVLGQHVPSLRFLSMLLGDQPALDLHMAFYQRLLAGDRDEARLIATQHAAAKGLENVPDDVMVPALRLARRDRNAAGLTADDETFVFESTQEILTQLHLASKERPDAGVLSTLPRVVGCAAHQFAEELTLQMLGKALAEDCRFEIVSTRVLPAEIEAQIQREEPAVLFIAVMPPGGLSQARYLCRRLHHRFPNLKIVIGYFGQARDFDALLVKMRSAGTSYVSTSVLQSRKQIRSLLPIKPAVETTESTALAPVQIVGAASCSVIDCLTT